MKDIPYSTVEAQLQKLKNDGLIIENDNHALDNLQLYGYSNLIKSYRDPYVIKDSSGHKTYRDGVTFDQIKSLYLLDKNLRNAVMASMLDLEEYIKEASAEIIARDFGTNPSDYLLFRNYRDRPTNYKFSLREILKNMNNSLASDKDPIRHYRIAHGIVPPWILFKNVYFSTIVNFIKLFKNKQKTDLASTLYTLSPNFSVEQAKKLMLDTLYICLEYRNLSAHGGRVYNYSPNSTCRAYPNSSGFNLLLQILKDLKYKSPYYYLHRVLTEEVNRHCSAYPQDVTYLGQVLNINIRPQTIVYISEKSKKIHLHAFCSGSQSLRPIEFNKNLLQKYVPCKRCGKNISAL